MQHLDEGTIHAWLDGALDATESARIEQHAAECATCSAAVAEARGLIAGASRIAASLDLVRGGVIPKHSLPAGGRRSVWRRMRLTPLRAALAASLLLAVATLSTIRGDKPAASPVVATASAPVEDRAPLLKKSQAAAAARPAPPAPSAAKVVRTDSTKVVAQAPAAKLARDAAEKQLDKTAAAVVATSAPAALAASVDSARRNEVMPTAGAGARVEAATGRFTDARNLPSSAAMRTLQRAADVRLDPAVGCYEIASDSVAAALRESGFPQRFSLEPIAGSPRGSVRAVSAIGRPDTLLPNFNWERVQPNMTAVFWRPPTATQTLRRAISFRAGETPIIARADAPSGTRTFELNRMDCRP